MEKHQTRTTAKQVTEVVMDDMFWMMDRKNQKDQNNSKDLGPEDNHKIAGDEQPRDHDSANCKHSDLNNVPEAAADVFLNYTVTLGDTLQGIALKFGTSTHVVKKTNGMLNDRLNSHQTLRIPLQDSIPNLNAPNSDSVHLSNSKKFYILSCVYPTLGAKELDYYLKTSSMDLVAAVKMIDADEAWSKSQEKFYENSEKSIGVDDSVVSCSFPVMFHFRNTSKPKLQNSNQPRKHSITSFLSHDASTPLLHREN